MAASMSAVFLYFRWMLTKSIFNSKVTSCIFLELRNSILNWTNITYVIYGTFQTGSRSCASPLITTVHTAGEIMSHAHKPGGAGLLKSDSWQPMQYRFKLLWYRNTSSDCELWRAGVSAQTAWSWWHRSVQSGSSLLFFSRCRPKTLKSGAESVSLSRMFQLHFCLSDTVYHVFTPPVSQPASVVIFLLWNLSVSCSTHSTRNQSNWVH